MNKIHKPGTGYKLLKLYIDWCCNNSYRRNEIKGVENIPTDGAVIFAPNHCNTLLDALVVLKSTDGAKLFGARADVFNNPTVARIMYFLRIIPMVRMRDGIRNVAKNRENIDIAINCLKHKLPFCIFPEGRHRTKHSLQNFGKGLQRTALGAYEKFGDTMPIYIVPVGIEYGDYFRYRSTSLVSFGKAININEHLKTTADKTPAEINQEIAEMVHAGIAEQITYLPDDENYNARWALLKILTSEEKGKPSSLTAKRKHVIADMLAKENSDKERMNNIYKDAIAFEKARKSAGISSYSLTPKSIAAKATINTIFLLLLLPLTLFSLVVTLPMWLITLFVIPSVKDDAFKNTARFGIKAALLPLMTVVWSVLFFLNLHWIVAITALLCSIFAFDFLYDIEELARRTTSHWKALFNSRLKEKYAKIRNSFKTN